MATLFFAGVGLLALFGCSKKYDEIESLFTDEEFNHILATTGSTPDKEAAHAIRYSDYRAGASPEQSKALVFEKLNFYALKFPTSTEAKKEALRLNQYYSRNWLFDKVEGEPLLEDMVILKFHASNPTKRIQRKPIHTPRPVHAAPEGAPAH